MSEDAENRIDVALMARIGAEDEDAFRELIERHQDRVFGTVARMIGGAGPDAEDLAQQIFLRVWRAAPKWQPTAKVTTWMMTITRNLVFSFSESRARRKEESGESIDPETGETFLTAKGGVTKRNPQEELSGKELVREVERACAQLPKNQRMVVHLRQQEEMEYEEIAKVMGMSVLAVKSLIFRARETLKIKLSGYFRASN
jgi:RNA polymerase sigma-70 factor (ECF subfamily)